MDKAIGTSPDGANKAPAAEAPDPRTVHSSALVDRRNGEGAQKDELPKVYALAEVLKNLAGVCGRTFVLEHLKKTPEHGGGPTHRRWGNKIVFYAEDIPRLMASLERPPRPDPARRPAMERPSLSADKAFRTAQRLVKKQIEKRQKAQKPAL